MGMECGSLIRIEEGIFVNNSRILDRFGQLFLRSVRNSTKLNVVFSFLMK